MFVLSFFALVSGYFFFDLFVGYGSLIIFDPKLSQNYILVLEFLTQKRKFFPLLIVFMSIICFVLVVNFFLVVFLYCFNKELWS